MTIMIGNNSVVLGGRVMLPSQPAAVILTFVIASIYQIVFLVLVAVPVGLWAITSMVMVSFITLFLLIRSTFCDPGIIPRNSLRHQNMVSSVARPRGSIRFCQSCNIWMPPRSKHCHICDNCIAGFDHHCNFIGTCIGRRNRRSLVLLILSATIMIGLDVAIALDVIVHTHLSLPDHTTWSERAQATFAQSPATTTLLFIGVVALIVMIGLSAAQLYLVVKQLTTYEFLRRTFQDRPNPYNRGGIVNCFGFFCHRASPSDVLPVSILTEVTYR